MSITQEQNLTQNTINSNDYFQIQNILVKDFTMETEKFNSKQLLKDIITLSGISMKALSELTGIGKHCIDGFLDETLELDMASFAKILRVCNLSVNITKER